MAVDDQFGERDPAQKVDAHSRQLNEEGEVRKVNFRHSKRSNKNEAASIPVQARLKSSAAANTIGQVAREMGIKASAIRYYEAQGLLTPLPRSAGRRIFTSDALARLRVIVEARRLGIGIKELRLLHDRPTDEWRARLVGLAAELENVAAQVKSRIERLKVLSRCTCSSALDCILETPPA